MAFINKEKKGFIGRIYFKFLRSALKNNNYKFLTVESSSKIAKYSKIFSIDHNNIKFLPWSRNVDPEFDILNESNFLTSIVMPTQEFKSIETCLADFSMEAFVFSDIEKRRNNGNLYFTGTVKLANATLAKAFCEIVFTDDSTVSAEQTLLITKMSLKKPIIVTKSEALSDDCITKGLYSLINEKNKESLFNVVKSNYKLILEDRYKIWENNYNIYKMGINLLYLINGGNV